MRSSIARYSAPVSFIHAPSLADFITIIVGFKFSVHTGVCLAVGVAVEQPFGNPASRPLAQRLGWPACSSSLSCCLNCCRPVGLKLSSNGSHKAKGAMDRHES